MEKLKLAMEKAKERNNNQKTNQQYSSSSSSSSSKLLSSSSSIARTSGTKSLYDGLLNKKPGLLKIKSKQSDNNDNKDSLLLSQPYTFGSSISLKQDEDYDEETVALLNMKAEVLEKLKSGEITESGSINMETLSSFPSNNGKNLLKRGKIVVDTSLFDFNSKKRTSFDSDSDDDDDNRSRTSIELFNLLLHQNFYPNYQNLKN